MIVRLVWFVVAIQNAEKAVLASTVTSTQIVPAGSHAVAANAKMAAARAPMTLTVKI